jgi:hypothetical protein
MGPWRVAQDDPIRSAPGANRLMSSSQPTTQTRIARAQGTDNLVDFLQPSPRRGTETSLALSSKTQS